VLDPEHVHSILKDGETIQIGMNDHVGHVHGRTAARLEPDDPFRHPAVQHPIHSTEAPAAARGDRRS
jgi:hypothetical protein